MKISFLNRFCAVLALLLLVTVLAVFPRTGWGRDKGDGPPVTVEADRLNYDEDGDTYDASGNVVIRYEEGVLKAEDVRVSRVTGESEARGGVELQSGSDVLKGERARFNFRDKTGVLYDGEVFFPKTTSFSRGGNFTRRGGHLSGRRWEGDHLRRGGPGLERHWKRNPGDRGRVRNDPPRRVPGS